MEKEPQFDALITRWLEEEAPLRLPERVLDNTFERTRKSRQQAGWRGILGRFRIHRLAPALGSAVVVVVAVGVAVSLYFNQQSRVGPLLPAAVDAWSRASVDSRFSTAQLDTFAAGPRGLLALVGELGSGAFQLAVSNDGQEWLQVPGNQHPSLEGHSVRLAGTDQGFLLVVDNDVWTSVDGFNWDRLAGSVDDPDLRQGEIFAVAATRQGFVAVGGNNMAWHSTNGSDWSLANVPPPPAEVFERPGFTGAYVAMLGIAMAGDKLVAWGNATAENGLETIAMPVLWISSDGLSWVSVPDLQMDSVPAVAGGPNGFVAIGADVPNSVDARYSAWFSADGRDWQKGNDLAYLNDAGVPVTVAVKSVAATVAGYVAVGAINQCVLGPCPSLGEAGRPMEAVLWTSADGLSWTRLPRDDLFSINNPTDPDDGRSSDATAVKAWESRFVVGGHYDSRPVVWISALDDGGNVSPPAPRTTPVSSEEPTPSRPAEFAGNWVATDVDSSQQTMEIVARAGDTYEVVIHDDSALVCGGVSSTLIGIGESRQQDSIVIPQPEYACDDGATPIDPSGPLDENLKDLTFFYDFRVDELNDSLGLNWRRALPARSASRRPLAQLSLIAWDSDSAGEDWPAPPRTETGGAALASAAPVAPGWVQFTDLDADTTPGDIAAVDIHTIQIASEAATRASRPNSLH